MPESLWSTRHLTVNYQSENCLATVDKLLLSTAPHRTHDAAIAS